jgi:hypothetical protein
LKFSDQICADMATLKNKLATSKSFFMEINGLIGLISTKIVNQIGNECPNLGFVVFFLEILDSFF